MENRVIIIAGPTASGKTALSIKVAMRLNTEIISADSRQIFKYLNIGTAKPPLSTLALVKHHLIDILEPDAKYNASMFEQDSIEIIRRLHILNKIPVITGGTGLYISALRDGIFNTADTDDDYRQKLHKIKDSEGNEKLYSMLKEVDPQSAETMLPQNWKRVMRALEVFHLTGISLINHHKNQEKYTGFNFFYFSIEPERNILYENIEKRVDIMILNGLIKEVSDLIRDGWSPKLNSLNTVGYKEIISFLNKEISLQRAVELIKRNSRHYAKRQFTWLRRIEDRIPIDPQNYDSIDSICEFIISYVK